MSANYAMQGVVYAPKWLADISFWPWSIEEGEAISSDDPATWDVVKYLSAISPGFETEFDKLFADEAAPAPLPTTPVVIQPTAPAPTWKTGVTVALIALVGVKLMS